MTWPSGLAMSDIVSLVVEGPIFTGKAGHARNRGVQVAEPDFRLVVR